jgi:hypothetical protein
VLTIALRRCDNQELTKKGRNKKNTVIIAEIRTYGEGLLPKDYKP